MILYNIAYYYVIVSFGIGFYELFAEKYREFELNKRINYNNQRNLRY